MGDNSHPWRDIYSNAAWQRLLDHQGGALRGQYSKLTELIAAYHALAKSVAKRDAFEQRRVALARIGLHVETLLQRTPAAAKSPGAAPKFKADERAEERQRYVTGTLEAEMPRWLESLWRRCHKKSGYLKEMADFYDRYGWSTSHEATPEQFMRYLNNVDKRREKDTQMHLTAQNRLERLDPYHRSAELSFTAADEKNQQIQASELPLSQALCAWLLDNSATQTPFYVWLESHPICTSTPGLDADFEPDFKSRVRGTRYLPAEELPVYAVTIRNHLLVRRGEQEDVPLDTRGGRGKSFLGAYAYVRTRAGDFYTAPHGAPGAGLAPIHHSSFTQGRKVQSAGMWQVQQGKVTLIDNNTGHYRTDIGHMVALVNFLKEQGVLAADAKIDDVLGLAARGSARSVEDWLQMAESLDDKHQHKPIQKPSGLHGVKDVEPKATGLPTGFADKLKTFVPPGKK